MSVQIEKRNFTPKIKEVPPPKPLETLKTKKCFVCGSGECHNGTRVELESSNYLVRVCKNEACQKTIHTVEGLQAIKSKNLLTPSHHKQKQVNQKAVQHELL
jgi:hypothetical protein